MHEGNEVAMSERDSPPGPTKFTDYSDVRLKLVEQLIELDVDKTPLQRQGFLGAAVVVLHSAIEEWVTGHLRADVRTLSCLKSESYNMRISELALDRRSWEWKVEELALHASGRRWGLARGTDEVKALVSLCTLRNRLVHMELHGVEPPPLFSAQQDPPPEEAQLYEVVRLHRRVTAQMKDGSQKTWEASYPALDPWRAFPVTQVQYAEDAFRKMRIQYDGATGDDVGGLEFSNGPIWKERKQP